jgi:hypothetical protein
MNSAPERASIRPQFAQSSDVCVTFWQGTLEWQGQKGFMLVLSQLMTSSALKYKFPNPLILSARKGSR